MTSNTRILRSIAPVIIAGVLVIQALLLWKQVIRPWFHENSGVMLMSAHQRDAVMFMGEDRARYLRFLDAYLPEDIALVIPRDYVFFSSQNVMQNFLFPRAILACAGSTDPLVASRCLGDPENYVLAIDNFPAPSQVPGRVLVSYPEADSKLRGVYVPLAVANRLALPSLEVYGKTAPVSVRALLTDIALLALLFALGGLAAQIILGRALWLDLIELAIPLAMGLFTWLLFLIGFAGARVTLPTSIAVYLLLLCAALGLHYAIYRGLPRIPRLAWRTAVTAIRDISPFPLLLWMTLAGALLLMGFLAVANGYSDFDSIANWSLKGYAIAGTGDILAGRIWGGHVLSYPLNLALSIALFKLADGDLIPGSKFLYALFTISLLFGCGRFLLRRKVSQTAALLGVLLLLTVPVFFGNAISGIANLPFTVYLVLGILHSLDGISGQDLRETLLGGLLLAFAAWTRPEGLMFGLVFLLLIYCLALVILRTRPRGRLVLVSFLPMLIIPLTWMTLVGGKALSGDQIGQALGLFVADSLKGNLHPEAALQLLIFARRLVAGVEIYGYSLAACGIVVVVTLPVTHWYRDRYRLLFALLTLLAFLLPAAMFFVAFFREQDFGVFLEQSFDRAYLPALTMSVLTAILALSHQTASALETITDETMEPSA